MKLQELKETVCRANIDLVRHGLVLFTWGNVSGIDRERGLVVIKPSGIDYDDLRAEMMVVLDLDGDVVEGNLRPSSDTATHMALYRAFEHVQGIVHTHSTYAAAWSQARRDIPAVGTTHADYFYRDIPCTRPMTAEEIDGDYEAATGRVIVDCFESRKLSPVFVPGVLVSNHGPFTWGSSVDEAVHNAVVLEEVAKTTCLSAMLNPKLPMNPKLIEKHFRRKHGPGAYYGQVDNSH
ncbi:MAG TPA: L-ribulose-5-phosphate 4-epimerase [Planctomycetaceae bacterium]|nr:L-ribulose-5-phosphate 4-epimerase [Planctomycetaceae bacterium]